MHRRRPLERRQRGEVDPTATRRRRTKGQTKDERVPLSLSLSLSFFLFDAFLQLFVTRLLDGDVGSPPRKQPNHSTFNMSHPLSPSLHIQLNFEPTVCGTPSLLILLTELCSSMWFSASILFPIYRRNIISV